MLYFKDLIYDKNQDIVNKKDFLENNTPHPKKNV